MRRISAAISLVLLGLLTIALAQAAVVALLFVFSLVLKLRLGIEVGAGALVMGSESGYWQPQVTVFNGATVASTVFTTVCGVVIATWRFGRWRPLS